MSDKTPKSQNDTVIQALLDNSQLFPAKFLSFFFDIPSDDLEQVKKIWPKVALERKISLLADLEEMMEADTLLSCDGLGKVALNDDFPEVRSSAISLLYECDDPKLASLFGEMLENDESELVQTTAAVALGKFVLLGELEEIPSHAADRTIKALTAKLNLKPFKELQQELVKSLAYSSRPEIATLIEKARLDPDPSWQLAAIIAMGRSADSRWEKPILQMIQSDNPDYKKEAVKAAGELELSSARAILLQMLEDEVDDGELRLVIIWALSKIGGENVKSVLQNLLDDTGDEEEAEAIEMALEALDFSSELPDLDF
ncbi:MAG: HEAT repeat domain-containing protein [Anaerolineaceae bacterium]|nr:HEAT repeat domain-containing protein [Anaerolineaceae bacterium]